jgi:methyl-accepting chemotaxis protein
MKSFFSIVVLVAMLTPAFAGEAPPASEQAKGVETLVIKAATLVEKEGKTAAFTGDTYLYAYDSKGNVLLNAAFPQREGTNIAGQRDTKGKPFQDETLEVAATQGSGWVSYMFPKPGQSESSEKWAYVKKDVRGDSRSDRLGFLSQINPQRAA